jgi:hypothetical protein
LVIYPLVYILCLISLFVDPYSLVFLSLMFFYRSVEPCNIVFVRTNSIRGFNFDFPSKYDLFACISSDNDSVEPSLVDLLVVEFDYLPNSWPKESSK